MVGSAIYTGNETRQKAKVRLPCGLLWPSLARPRLSAGLQMALLKEFK